MPTGRYLRESTIYRPKLKMKPTHYIDDPENSLNIIIFELSTCRSCGEIDLNEGGTVSMPEFSAMGLDLQQYEPGVLPPSTCPNCAK